MKKTNIVQIRKKGGLNSIVKDKNSGSTIRPMMFNSKTKNPNEDGTLEGEYRGKTILGTKHFISPNWLDLKNQWSFDGSEQDLRRLIDGMKLKYPHNHELSGKTIKGSTSDAERLGDIADPVFANPALYGKYYMENARVSLDLSDPRQEFLYRCYKGDSQTDDKSSDEAVSKYIAAGTKYEIVSPRKENVKAKQSADKEIEAIKLLAAMDSNEQKLRAIAVIMALPQYAPSTDVSGIFLLLKDTAAQNIMFSPKYGKSYQDRFIELAQLSDDDLNINFQVASAKNKGFLRKRQGFYLFNGEKIDGIDSDLQLVNFFRNPKNQEEYMKLINLLDNERTY